MGGQFREWTKNKKGNYKVAQNDPKGCWVKTRAAESDEWASELWLPTFAKNWDTAIPDQTDDHPVTCVVWNDAIEFTKWLGSNGDGWTCSLPTAAQWEYAAKGSGTPCKGPQPDNEKSTPQKARGRPARAHNR